MLGRRWLQNTKCSGDACLYTYRSLGDRNIEEMKRLAHRYAGLNTFISRNVKYRGQ